VGNSTLLVAPVRRYRGPGLDKAWGDRCSDLARASSRLREINAQEGLLLLRACFGAPNYYSYLGILLQLMSLGHPSSTCVLDPRFQRLLTVPSRTAAGSKPLFPLGWKVWVLGGQRTYLYRLSFLVCRFLFASGCHPWVSAGLADPHLEVEDFCPRWSSSFSALP